MKRNYIIGLIIFIFFLIMPLIVLKENYSNQIIFDSSKFSEEYLKFLGTLVSVAFGFYLVNILWTEKVTNELINQTKNFFLNCFLRINRICQNILDLLAKNYIEEKYDESQKRDIEIQNQVEKIFNIGLSLEHISIDFRTLKDDPVKNTYIELIWCDLLPSIEILSSLKNFRKDYERFSETVNIIKDLTIKGQKALINSIEKGQENE
jgi:hypothetical protein